MAIRFDCQKCGKSLKVRDDNAGRKTQCPDCQTILRVPQVDDVEEAEIEEAIEEVPRVKAARVSSKVRSSSPSRARSADLDEPVVKKKKKSTKSKSTAGAPKGTPVWIIASGGLVAGGLMIA